MNRRNFLAVAAGVLAAGCSGGSGTQTPTLTPVELGEAQSNQVDTQRDLTPTTVIEETVLQPNESHGFRIVVPQGYALALTAVGVIGAGSSSAPSRDVTARVITQPTGDATTIFKTAQAYANGSPLTRVEASDAGFVVAFEIHNASNEIVEASAAFRYAISEL